MEIATVRDITVIVGSLIGVCTLLFGIFQYRRASSINRAGFFSQLQQELYGLLKESNLGNMLETGSVDILRVPSSQKLAFLGFYEKIAIMRNSGLIRKRVAFYMFSYYAIRCLENEDFWKEMNLQSPYWRLFKDFAEEMQAIERSLQLKPVNNSDLRF